jgi:hypothetical protein
MATTTKQEHFDLSEPEQRDPGVGRRRFLAGLGAGAVALGVRGALGAEAMGPIAAVDGGPGVEL